MFVSNICGTGSTNLEALLQAKHPSAPCVIQVAQSVWHGWQIFWSLAKNPVPHPVAADTQVLVKSEAIFK